MRLIKLLVPDEHLDGALEVLSEEDIDFVVTKDATERRSTSLVEFPLPTQAVGYVLDELRAAGVDDEEYTVIASAETAKTTHFHELEERFVAGVEEDDAVAREEIRAKALDMHRNELTYYSMTIFSAIVAAAGLLMDSPAVVVGAMVIAPQVGSALVASVGIALNDRRMIYLGFREQVLGFSVAIVGALLFGWLLQSGQFVTSVLDVATVGQISKRISPGLLSVSVAVCAGAAGAFGLATALPVSLVGVMIAAALIPAAAAVGIGIAWGIPSVSLGAFLLLVVNAVVVNLAGFLVLWYLGYRPDEWEFGDGRPRVSGLLGNGYRHAVVALVALLVVFAAAGGVLTQQVAFENEVNEAVEKTFEGQGYDRLRIERVSTEVSPVRFFGTKPEVQLVVSRPADESFPRLAERVRNRIERRTGRQVSVQVEFVEQQESRPG